MAPRFSSQRAVAVVSTTVTYELLQHEVTVEDKEITSPGGCCPMVRTYLTDYTGKVRNRPKPNYFMNSNFIFVLSGACGQAKTSGLECILRQKGVRVHTTWHIE